jgi:S-adenosylmethionine:diacylglycerol 3-amino-3-carboxypropyl transferase
MSAEERLFWQAHSEVIEKGVISTGRFERYVSSFSRLALHLLGKKQILGLMELNTVSEQEKFFDERINLKMLRKLFAFIFRPSRYRNRAISEQGLQNAGTESKADFYFSRFRKFCTATPARNNYYLQYFLFNKILYQEALPGYLTEKGMERIRRNRNKIEFINASFRDSIVQNPRTPYNKFHLSNISDWMNPGEFESLLETIDGTSERPFRMLSRHLHHAVSIPGALRNKMVADSRMKDLLLENDKFPFYNVLPISSR